MEKRRRISLPGEPVEYAERRRKKDWVVRSVSVIAAIGWFLSLLSLLLIDRASPQQQNFLTRFLDIRVVSSWNSAMLRIAFAMVLASCVTCIIGFILNAARHRRKSDRYSKLLITVSIVSAVMFVLYLVFFARYM